MYGTNSLVNSTEDSLILNQKVRIYRTYNNVLEGEYYPIFTLSSNKVKIENIQIEQNTVATDYVEHKEQILPLTLGNIELCKIGDYQDYFWKDETTSKWYLHKETGKVVYDGSETGSSRYWYVQDENTYSYQITDNTIHLKESKKGICNRFIINSSGASPYLYPILQTGTSYCRFVTYNITGTTSTLEEWKRWLSSNNIVFYYPLKTQTDTEITSTTLISQLEAISNALSYEEQTNIIGSSNGSNPIFSVEACLDSKVILAEKYVKPDTGIPKTDLASAVQTSLNKADSAIQEHQDISGKEDKTNKVTSIDNTSTDTQYPSAKCVYDSQEEQNTEIENLQTENERLKATLPTTTGEGQDITLDKTAEMEFIKPPLPMGNSEQNGEPSPDNEVFITNVTGNVEVTISNENNTESKTLPVSLGNIELCKIGNYQDYLYKNNGKWYVHNAIKKLVLNGSENWGGTTSYNYNVFAVNLDNYARILNQKTVYSNYYNGIPNTAGIVDFGNNYNNSIGVRTANDHINNLYISNNEITTVEDFKSWLSTHNTIVYYVLATPTDTEITDTTLISQLEEISKTLSYQGQTNITSNTIALFDVEAYQSTKLVLEEMATAIVALGGV